MSATTEQKNPNRVVITPLVRLSYPNLITPSIYKENGREKGDPTFNTQLLFPEADLENFHLAVDGGFEKKNLKDICADLAKEKWPGQSLKDLFPEGKRWPIVKGEKIIKKLEAKGKKGAAYEGQIVLRAKSNTDYPPVLKVIDKGKKINLDRDLDSDVARAKQLFVGGYYVRCELNIKGHSVKDDDDVKNYITFYLSNVLFIKQGERLGQGSAMDRFDGIDGGESDHNPLADLDDEVPF